MFNPKLWASAFILQMQQNSVFVAMATRPLERKWEVWFAWFPVRITVVTNITEIHDEVTVESYTRWRWLTCVARRRRFYATPRIEFRKYDYGPSTNALMQPPRRFYSYGE